MTSGQDVPSDLLNLLKRSLKKGKYSLELVNGKPKILGSGAFAHVLKVTNSLGEPRALKLLKRPRAKDDKAVNQFMEEVRKQLSARHPNVVAIEDVNRLPKDRDGLSVPYYIMEYVDGHPIDKWAKNQAKRRARPTAAEVCAMIRQILEALHTMHDRKLFHLDLKPANILVTRGGVTKIADFGLARLRQGPVELQSAQGREFSAMHPVLKDKIWKEGGFRGKLKPSFDLYGVGYTLSRPVIADFFRRALGYPPLQYFYDSLMYGLTAAEPSDKDFPARHRFAHYESVAEYETAKDALVALEKLENPLSIFLEVPELQMGAISPPIRVSTTVHIPTTRRLRRIVDTQVFQRLRDLHQLDQVHFVYPGATHSRFEHSLSCYYYTLRYLNRLLQIPFIAFHCTSEEIKATLLAGLLHDVRHYPMAHAIEDSALMRLERHEKIGREFLEEKKGALSQDEIRFFEILRRDWKVEPKLVAEIAFGPSAGTDGQSRRRRLLHTVIHSPIDSDRMAYLQTDARHTGNPVGTHFDCEQLIDVLSVNKDGNGIAIDEKGIAATESFLYARYRMYIDVYCGLHPENSAEMR